MRSINKVIIIGNVTRDPEIKQTSAGQPIATFGIATNRDWMTRDHQKHTSSEFHEVVAWAKLAEICQKYIHKGKLVYIEGYLKTRSWDTPEGTKKFKTEIVINDMIMLDKRAPGDISIPGNDGQHYSDDGANMEEMQSEDRSEADRHEVSY